MRFGLTLEVTEVHLAFKVESEADSAAWGMSLIAATQQVKASKSSTLGQLRWAALQETALQR